MSGRNGRIKLGGLYEESTFDKSILPSWMDKELREVVETAVSLGWKMHLSSANSVTIVSHDDRKRYHFNVGGRSSTPMNRVRRDVMKFAEPSKMLAAGAAVAVKDEDPEVMELLMRTLPKVGDEGTVVDHREEERQAAREREQRRLQAAREREQQWRDAPAETEENTSAVAPAAPKQPEPEISIETPTERHIISSKPMRASGGNGRAYDSQVTEERLWSDGTKDYKCQRCDYTTTNRQSVAGHNAVKHGAAQGERPQRYFAEVPDATPYAPRANRVEALAEVLDAILNAHPVGSVDARDLAREALVWTREHSRKGTALSEDREDRTPEETLARIRALLDDGTATRLRQEYDDLERQMVLTLEQVDDLTNRLAHEEVRANEAEAKAAAAEAKAEQARSTLRAFMDLAKDLDPESESA